MRYHVMQSDYSEEHPQGVSVRVFETDDAREARLQAQELSVPGNTAWVLDTCPEPTAAQPYIHTRRQS